jgi:hypothetical protein
MLSYHTFEAYVSHAFANPFGMLLGSKQKTGEGITRLSLKALLYASSRPSLARSPQISSLSSARRLRRARNALRRCAPHAQRPVTTHCWPALVQRLKPRFRYESPVTRNETQ